ncbi:hypothetical protein chiPu_0012860 [Chiloscyllium punctatum]|uniref:Uncharacterized protein n=1 Tax=Chiloscyllium punctatum TaxID=137246 RepID=A0A401SVF4_CHIPU|nr:hypothetical protein [Chiloscyllium punctatum]
MSNGGKLWSFLCLDVYVNLKFIPSTFRNSAALRLRSCLDVPAHPPNNNSESAEPTVVIICGIVCQNQVTVFKRKGGN